MEIKNKISNKDNQIKESLYRKQKGENNKITQREFKGIV